jgi:SAM-dependent methyltransferase
MISSLTTAIRESYDHLADEYARRIYRELEGKPFDRELLHRFAKEVEQHGNVCDIGCGPGHVTRYFQNAGADVFGLDISPGMVELARQLNPGTRFVVGDMLALDLPEGGLAGAVAFYAIVNIQKEFLPSVFCEMCRVLRSGGRLLLAFQHRGRSRALRRVVGTTSVSRLFLFPNGGNSSLFGGRRLQSRAGD